MENYFPLIPLFFTTALTYSLAGLGGGSTYLALLALFSFPLNVMRPLALLCNIAVVSNGFWQFRQNGHFSFQKILPFLVTSIPAAYWGGTITLGKQTFTILLALSLLVAASRMLWGKKIFEPGPALSPQKLWGIGLTLGALLGFLSGLVGIGGGIYLTPVLLFLRWTDAKQAAALSSFFILVNSLSGLAGQFSKGLPSLNMPMTVSLLVAVILGGQIGSRLGAVKIPKLALQRIMAILIFWVSGQLLWRLW